MTGKTWMHLKGSILWILIFNIFLNRFFYFVYKSSIHNYADENYMSVHYEGSGLVERVPQQQNLLIDLMV